MSNEVDPEETASRLRRAIEEAGISRRAPAIILLAADAGLARQEIHRLYTEDVELASADPESGSAPFGFIHIRVRSAADRPKHDRGTAGGGRARSVPILTSRLAQALQELPRRDGRLLGLRSADGVVSVASRPWRVALGRSAELHRLRHRFITRLLESPHLSPEQVRLWAGHRLLRTTQGYAHVDPTTVPAGAGATLVRHEPATPDPPRWRGDPELRWRAPCCGSGGLARGRPSITFAGPGVADFRRRRVARCPGRPPAGCGRTSTRSRTRRSPRRVPPRTIP